MNIKIYNVYDRCNEYIPIGRIVRIRDQGTHHGAKASIVLDTGKIVFTSEQAADINKQMRDRENENSNR